MELRVLKIKPRILSYAMAGLQCEWNFQHHRLSAVHMKARLGKGGMLEIEMGTYGRL
jgi:hypothetical protein